jgi:hypothetical protein
VLRDHVDSQRLIQMVTKEELVPKDHLLRQLRNVLNLSFVRLEVAEL